MSTPADWYPDPSDPMQRRWWDGQAWTHNVRPPAGPQNRPPPAIASEPQSPSAPNVADYMQGSAQPQGASGKQMLRSTIDQLASHDGSDTYRISEEGRNGSVTFSEKGLDRTIKKTLSKNDRQFIPYTKIAMVRHDRRRLGRDVVIVQVGSASYTWKVVADAEGFVNRLNPLIA